MMGMARTRGDWNRPANLGGADEAECFFWQLGESFGSAVSVHETVSKRHLAADYDDTNRDKVRAHANRLLKVR